MKDKNTKDKLRYHPEHIILDGLKGKGVKPSRRTVRTYRATGWIPKILTKRVTSPSGRGLHMLYVPDIVSVILLIDSFKKDHLTNVEIDKTLKRLWQAAENKAGGMKQFDNFDDEAVEKLVSIEYCKKCFQAFANNVYKQHQENKMRMEVALNQLNPSIKRQMDETNEMKIYQGWLNDADLAEKNWDKNGEKFRETMELLNKLPPMSRPAFKKLEARLKKAQKEQDAALEEKREATLAEWDKRLEEYIKQQKKDKKE